MKPRKSDFPAFTTFSMNIPDANINPHIDDAFKFDLKPRLGVLADDILAYSGTDKPQLKEFYENFILQWWVLLAFKRFMQVHGKNITQFGVTRTKGDSFEAITTEERAVILRQLNGDIGTLSSLAFAEEWKFDNVSYRKGSDCRTGSPNDFGINAIG